MCLIPASGIHPISREFLILFYNGDMPVWDFLRMFGLADSRLIDLGFCLAELLA